MPQADDTLIRMTMTLATAFASFAQIGCGRITSIHEPVFHTPLVEGMAPEERPEEQAPDPSETADIRKRAVAFANALLADPTPREDFGETDVARLFEHIGSTLPWQPKDGAGALARLAQKRRAYAADGRPEPGDIVLFHNQRDANDNRENDDWHTGCGIVVETVRFGFTAVIRTGHRARKVTVSPGYPSIREHNGETINTFVRIPTPSDPPDTAYLAGQLYAGHIDLEKMPSR